MTFHYVGDLHLGHQLVADQRGFGSTDEHDEFILDQLSKIPSTDDVAFLGDSSSGREAAEERALELISGFSFGKHLFAGNHDSVSSIHRNGFKRQKRWMEVFDSIRDFGAINMNREKVLLSHFPYHAIGDGDGRGPRVRYSEFRLPDTGLALIHAHTHQSFALSTARESTITKIFHRGYDFNSLCVSWDAFRRPISESDIALWMDARAAVKRGDLLHSKVSDFWDLLERNR